MQSPFTKLLVSYILVLQEELYLKQHFYILISGQGGFKCKMQQENHH